MPIEFGQLVQCLKCKGRGSFRKWQGNYVECNWCYGRGLITRAREQELLVKNDAERNGTETEGGSDSKRIQAGL